MPMICRGPGTRVVATVAAGPEAPRSTRPSSPTCLSVTTPRAGMMKVEIRRQGVVRRVDTAAAAAAVGTAAGLGNRIVAIATTSQAAIEAGTTAAAEGTLETATAEGTMETTGVSIKRVVVQGLGMESLADQAPRAASAAEALAAAARV